MENENNSKKGVMLIILGLIIIVFGYFVSLTIPARVSPYPSDYYFVLFFNLIGSSSIGLGMIALVFPKFFK